MNYPLNDTQALAPMFETANPEPPAIDSGRLRILQGVPLGLSANWRLAQGVDSLVAARAHGSHVWDTAGNEYVDYVCGLGTVLLGHAHPDVNAAISAQLELGIQTAATNPREIQLADELCAAMPGMDSIRFHISNAAAILTALKIARVATSRDLVVRFAGHYHGRQALGETLVLPWNDAEALRAAFSAHGATIAGVIVEPVMASRGGFEPAGSFLGLVRHLTSSHQSLFILNESFTGLRIALQGAIGKYLLTGKLGPDLVICGQSLGNGAPIGALAGCAKLMELLVTNAVPHFSTFNGNGLGIAAGLAMLSRLRLGGQGLYHNLTTRGRQLMSGLEQLGIETGVPVITRGPGPIFWVDLSSKPASEPAFDVPMAEHPRYEQFRHAMLEHGVRLLPGGTWYIGTAHDDIDIDLTLSAARVVLAEIGAAG